MELKGIFFNLKAYLKRRFGPKTLDEMISEYGFNSCFRLFPASYNRKYSPEKLKRMREAELAKLRLMLDEYEKRITEGKD